MHEDWTRHWEALYRKQEPRTFSWLEDVPGHSLELIHATGVPRDAPILDVGGGASRLVDHLLDEGYHDLSVLDVVPDALKQSRSRLGKRADRVDWIVADITRFEPRRRYALWHDRAVFHFLVKPEDARQYVRVLVAALAQGGHVILATFGPEGPARCSGLPVHRYSATDLTAALGPGFQLRHSELVDHRTPADRSQQFLFGWWQAVG